MKKTKWRTVRCIVEYRTERDLSEQDLARFVQAALDERPGPTLIESRPRAKGLKKAISRMEAVRPEKLRAAIRQLDHLLSQLREV